MTEDAATLDHRPASAVPGGIAGWLLRLVRHSATTRRSRELRVVETLSLGGHKQIALVTCGAERYLVGIGSDSVQTIVRVDAGDVCS